MLFVYNIGPEATCSAVSRLLAANAAGASISISKYSRATDGCPDQPDSWHQYVPANGLRPARHAYSAIGLSRLLQVRRSGAAPPSRPHAIRSGPASPGRLGCSLAADHQLQRVGRRDSRRAKPTMAVRLGIRHVPGRYAFGVLLKRASSGIGPTGTVSSRYRGPHHPEPP